MNEDPSKIRPPVIIAGLMPHAPVLVPAVGGGREREVANTCEAMTELADRIVGSSPDALVVISPHTSRRHGAYAVSAREKIHGSLGQFGAPDAAVSFANDSELAAAITETARERRLETWLLGESPFDHGAVVPLWYLSKSRWKGPTVVLGLSDPAPAAAAELGAAISDAARKTGRHVAVLASGDMSHRLLPGAPAGFHPRARQFDEAFVELVRRGEFHGIPRIENELTEIAAEDVVDSTITAVAAAGWNAAGHKVLSYEGPFGVGYCVAVLFDAAENLDQAQQTQTANEASARAVRAHAGEELPRIARRAVESALRHGAEMPPEILRGYLAEPRGVFVTLRDAEGGLRGCIGTLAPQERHVVDETWRLAQEAAFRDARFPPVAVSDVAKLRFEVSVLHPPEQVASPAELDPREFGVIVRSSSGRRGVLLPGIPGVVTVEHQLDIARRKAGIGRTEMILLERFRVDKFIEAGTEN